MTPPDDNAAIAAADRLQQSVEGLRTDIGGLTTYGRRNRRLIRWLTVSLIVEALLMVAVAVLAVQARQATSAAARNEQTQQATCRAGNESRAANRNLWSYVLDLSAATNPHPTPAQQEAAAKFRVFVGQVFAARDCAHLDRHVTVPTVPPR